MNEPRWYLISETIRNWAIAAGAVFIFFWYGCDLNTARRLSAEVDARVNKKTEPMRVQVAGLEAQFKLIQIAKEKAETKLAEQEAARNDVPTIRVQPTIDSSASHKGVRELSLDTQISNDGKVPVRVRGVTLAVWNGHVTTNVMDKISRTQRLWELEPYLSIAPPPNPDGLPNPPTKERVEYEALHRDCPHGQLFALDSSSKDVTWTKIDALSSVRTLEAELKPASALSQVFAFVLTENLYHNTGWFKFELSVELDDHSSQVFTFFVPTGREVDPRQTNYTVAKMVPGRLTEQSAVIYREWSTRSPLAPSAITPGDDQ